MARPHQQETRLFVERLLETARRGQELGDPRVTGTVKAWATICDKIPDALLKEIIPGTLRLLFRREAVAALLTTCGVREGASLQHEAIAPYVIAYRRMRRIRRDGGSLDLHALLTEARTELRELNARFHSALDEATRLQGENISLRVRLMSAKQAEASARAEAEKHRKSATTARNDLEDAAARTLGKLAIALQGLKEAMERRANDPASTLIESASLPVQSYYMVLEDLGRGKEAEKLAKRILGEKMGMIGRT